MTIKTLWSLSVKQLIFTSSGILIGGSAGMLIMLAIKKISFPYCPHFPSGFDCMFYPAYPLGIPIMVGIPITGLLLGPFIVNLFYDHFNLDTAP